MENYQQVTCDKCGSNEFEYDNAWQECTCNECGWIVNDPKKVSSIKRLQEESPQRYSNKKTILQSKSLNAENQPHIDSVYPDKQKIERKIAKENVDEFRSGGDDSQGNLIQSLFDIETETRRNKAIKNIVTQANQSIIRELGKALYNQDTDIHNIARITLYKIEINTKKNLERISKGEEKDIKKKRNALENMVLIQNLKSLLIQNLYANDNLIRKLSAKALEKLCDEKSVEPLIFLLRDKDKDVREIAVKSLAANINEKHADKLMDILKNEKNGVRKYVGRALISFYKSEIKGVTLIIPISVFGGLFAFFAGYLMGKPSGHINLGAILKGMGILLWFCAVMCALYILPKFAFRIAGVKKRIKGLDTSG